MSRDLFQNRFRIPSARATWHNYNGGIFFVTICTGGRQHCLGEIANGEMHLSEIGCYTDEQIRNVHAQIPLWVVMPNHLHAIVVIDGDNIPYKRRVANALEGPAVETWRAASLQPRGTANMQGWLSVVIGGIKSAVTKFANQNKILFSWQTRFHDHIIRHTDEMNRIAEYIETNVLRWEQDEFYS